MEIANNNEWKLEACNLRCVRGGREIFANVGFRLESGDALLIKGANGTGKSSLIRILAHMLKPEGGHVKWLGSPIQDLRNLYLSHLHYVGHLDCIKPSMTVIEHLRFWSMMRGNPNFKRDFLWDSDLLKLADVPGRFLSAGQKKRLSLARLSSIYAPLWLLDEPLVTLDSNSIQQLQTQITQQLLSGGIVVIATHTEFNLEKSQVIDMSSSEYSPVGTSSFDSELEEEVYDQW